MDDRIETYKTANEIPNDVLYNWMLIGIEDTKSVKTEDFKNEKHLEGWITENIELFCKEVLDDKHKWHATNYCVKPQKGWTLRPNERRVDIYIKGEKKDYLIELKKPRYLRENTAAIGQLLNYGREIQDAELILITTMFDIDTAKTISHFNLPIRYIYMSKDKMLEYKGVKEDG